MLKRLKYILKHHKIHAFFTSTIIRVEICRYIHSVGKKIFYINHGIWNTFAGEKFYNKKVTPCWRQFDGLFVTQNEVQYLLKLGIPEKRIHVINGSTQFDHVIYHPPRKMKPVFYRNINRKTGVLQKNTKYPLSTKTKCILLVQNFDHITDIGKRALINEKKDGRLMTKNAKRIMEDAGRHYYLILKELVLLAKKFKYHVFTKIKAHSQIAAEKFYPALANLHKDPIVTVVDYPMYVLYYDMLFSDITVIEGYGTSFVESLRLNPKTIQCQLDRHNDYLELKKFDLLRADSRRDLITKITTLITDPSQLITPDYLQNVSKYINYQFGDIKTGVSKDIVKIARANLR
jgi:hypothetical protein